MDAEAMMNEDHRLPVRERTWENRVLEAMRRRDDLHKRDWWLIKQIADDTRLPSASVQAALKRLQVKGYVSVSGRRGHPSVWRRIP